MLTSLVFPVYDVAREETFKSLGMWLQEVEQFSMGGGKEVVKLLVGNKVDQPRSVTRDRASEWALSRGMLFMEASPKTKEGIAQVFNEVVQKVGAVSNYLKSTWQLRLLRRMQILENPTLLSNTRPAKPGKDKLGGTPAPSNGSKGGCC
jgi:Ras-related protein Rab-18